MVALNFVARSAAYCTAVSELGKKSTGQRILLIVTMGNLRKTVAALLLSGRRADRVSDDVTGNDHLDPAIPLPAGCSVVRSHGLRLTEAFRRDQVGTDAFGNQEIANRSGPLF